MKTLIFSVFAAVALFTSTAAAAQSRPETRTDNYGYDKNHQVTPEERARWEEAHKDGRKDDQRADRKDERKDAGVGDRNDNRKTDQKEEGKADRKDDRKEARKDDRRDERQEKDFNYGFDKNHQVTPAERARWEAAHKKESPR